MPNDERFLVTGALGCLGSWTITSLIREGDKVVAFDLGEDDYRLRYLLSDDEIATVDFVRGDIADLDALERIAAEKGITHIIHLAALQVPFCRDDPPLGALVNVVGTVNVFEVAKRHTDHVKRVVFASSAVVYGTASDFPPGPLKPDVVLRPGTHYGVYKQANEGTARIYWQNDGISSLGLRPYMVYGLGCDQGVTSGAAKAMLAAAAGQSYHIAHGGNADFNLAGDVAKTLIKCARAPYSGTSMHNLRGEATPMADVVAAIESAAPAAAGSITFEANNTLPFAESFDSTSLSEIIGELPYTPFNEGVQQSVEGFERLIKDGKIDVERSLA